ncbi:MAG: secretin N-terminal domain-containing protein [Chlamydiota bacterium]
MKKKIFLVIMLIFGGAAFSQTIADKKRSLHEDTSDLDTESYQYLEKVNEQMQERRSRLEDLYDKVRELHERQALPEEYKQLLQEIKSIKKSQADTEEHWREQVSELARDEEGYALWHQPDTTIAQLVLDYGSQDYVYLMDPDIGAIKVSVNSSIPIPRESWNDMLEMILSQSGVGIRQLNPYLRELYFLQKDLSRVQSITNQRQDLTLLPEGSRVCFVVTPDVPDPHVVLDFLKRFSHEENTSLQLIGHNIFIVATVGEIHELLKVYDFAEGDQGGREYQLVSLSKIDSEDVAEVLDAVFHEAKNSENPDYSGLKIIPLKHTSPFSLFLIGTKDDIRRAEDVIESLELKGEGPLEKTIYTYSCKHSDAEDLANVLAKTYPLLGGTTESGDNYTQLSQPWKMARPPRNEEEARLAVSPEPVTTGSKKKAKKVTSVGDNFIVDPKTNSVIMVVEKVYLPMLQTLIRKVDVPKKMVLMEVLLFEKKVNDNNYFGLNLLRIGSKASQSHSTGASWSASGNAQAALNPKDVLAKRVGILDFFLSRKKTNRLPAYDLAYNFLISQQDVTIHANPSVITVNQTPAAIKIVDELSIKEGAAVDTDGDVIRDRYIRSQYGITIELTPTIHEQEDDEDDDPSITLEADITFDDKKPNSPQSLPEFTRRNIKNNVRIADGQTVVMGGLRRKHATDNKESMPFLGELPGVGKFFSETRLSDMSTEMIIFITPKIVSDNRAEIDKIQQDLLRWRPGDSPELVEKIIEAKTSEKERLFEGTMKMLFGRPDS